MGRWVIERSGRRVLELRASGRATRIGSDPSNDVVLDDLPPVAAVVGRDDGGVPFVRRLDHGDPSERTVVPGERLIFGEFSFSWEEAADRRRAEGTRRIEDSSTTAAPICLQTPNGPVVLEPGGRYGLGRDEMNDVVLGSNAVSSFHCEIGVRDGAWRVSDLGSTNGTSLDGVRIEQATLPSTGTLQLGDLRIPFGAQHSEAQETLFGLVGRSRAMLAVVRQIEVIARLEDPVLVLGETGTGKELVASALHAASPRARRRFLARNCGAIPESLADAELFGSRRGAFSGAVDKAGVFEGAEGGTVFLDELGELPLGVQAKLLRTIQQRTVQRLGELEDKPVSFRLVAATHRDLSRMVTEGTFRQDLFHRLGVFTIELPPLRDRREDIPLIAAHLLEGTGVQLTDEAIERLAGHDWPGNVRELRNCLIRASAFRVGSRIDAADLGLEPREPQSARSEPPLSVRRRRVATLDDEGVRAETEAIWEACGRSVSRAAARLGIAKSTMHRRKEFYNLPDPEA